MFFKCKHPAEFLSVEKDSTKESDGVDFEYITHHLFCKKCKTKVDITYAKLIGGVSGYISRNPSVVYQSSIKKDEN